MQNSATTGVSLRREGTALTLEGRLHWTLRVAAGLCFIGHGAFGFITKADWVPFFALVGIPPNLAYLLMPLVGTVDVTIGVLVLWQPRPIFLGYMAVWCVWTALLRPLDGRGWWEFLERAGNYGVPLALLAVSRCGPELRAWVRRLSAPRLDAATRARVVWILRVTVAALMIGHGGFGAFMHKQQLLDHFAAIGVPRPADPAQSFLLAIGWMEIGLGVAALLKPQRWLLAFILCWKLFSELLYPVSGDCVWEFVERAGSYGAPLALLFLVTSPPAPRRDGRRSRRDAS